MWEPCLRCSGRERAFLVCTTGKQMGLSGMFLVRRFSYTDRSLSSYYFFFVCMCFKVRSLVSTVFKGHLNRYNSN